VLKTWQRVTAGFVLLEHLVGVDIPITQLFGTIEAASNLRKINHDKP
jgi:hypothetical protein